MDEEAQRITVSDMLNKVNETRELCLPEWRASAPKIIQDELWKLYFMASELREQLFAITREKNLSILINITNDLDALVVLTKAQVAHFLNEIEKIRRRREKVLGKEEDSETNEQRINSNGFLNGIQN